MTEALLTGKVESQKKPTRKLRLLIVDGLPESRSLLRGALRNIEQVEVARETALAQNVPDILAESPVDMVLFDQNLTDTDVFPVVRALKSKPATANLKVVLISARLDMETRRKGMEVGIQSYLSKPYDLNTLERAVRDALGRVSTNHKDTLNKVRRIEFFSEFTDLELVRLLKICQTRKYLKGEAIFREGEKGDRMFVLILGQVNIVKHRDSGQEVVATLNAGESFGEMALVDQEPRSADVVAATDCMVIEVHAEVTNDINDVLALKLFRKMAILVTKKLREYTRAVSAAGAAAPPQ
jgi:CRP-like cAMP-binding protein/CheY-like chemotaxis protein